MIVMSELALRVVLAGLDRPDQPIGNLYTDLWTRMLTEGGLELELEPRLAFVGTVSIDGRDCWRSTVPTGHAALDVYMLDADELRQLVKWWSEYSDYRPLDPTALCPTA